MYREHAHNFRFPATCTKYEGKRCLIIGNMMADDIATALVKAGAQSVEVSRPTSGRLRDATHEGWVERGRVSKFQGNTASFDDGLNDESFDAVILCKNMGNISLHDLHFLPTQLRFESTNRYWLNGLYKGVVLESNPHIFFIGMQSTHFTLPLFEAQAFAIRDFILDRIKIPTVPEMIADDAPWAERQHAITSSSAGRFNAEVEFQADYITSCIALTGHKSFDIDKIKHSLIALKESKSAGGLLSRDRSFKSLTTDPVLPAPRTLWKEVLDDSLECLEKIEKQQAAFH